MTDQPLILTNKQHRECHERWARFKAEHPDRVAIAKRQFDVAECSVRAFGPHIEDVTWLDSHSLYEQVYGKFDPVDTLLEVLFFPPDSPLVDRHRYVESVKALIREHEDYGGEGNYMPRSVILGWVIRQHDLLLCDITEQVA